MRRCPLLEVSLSTLHFLANLRWKAISPGSRLSIVASASSIGAILMDSRPSKAKRENVEDARCGCRCLREYEISQEHPAGDITQYCIRILLTVRYHMYLPVLPRYLWYKDPSFSTFRAHFSTTLAALRLTVSTQLDPTSTLNQVHNDRHPGIFWQY